MIRPQLGQKGRGALACPLGLCKQRPEASPVPDPRQRALEQAPRPTEELCCDRKGDSTKQLGTLSLQAALGLLVPVCGFKWDLLGRGPQQGPRHPLQRSPVTPAGRVGSLGMEGEQFHTVELRLLLSLVT